MERERETGGERLADLIHLCTPSFCCKPPSKPKFASLDKVKVIADPEYKVYDSFGIGQIGYGGMFSWNVVKNLRSLAAEGIKNTPTGQGSNRWQNSGELRLVLH